MNKEQKEKWYNSFTREQLIERCEYLQRSCERKENSIMELEMENADLENIINKAIKYCEELMLFKKNSRQYLIGKCMLEILQGSDKE